MHGLISSSTRAFVAGARRNVITVVRYPDWMVSLIVWPILMPSLMVFGAKALAGPDSSGLAAFAQRAGTSDYVGFVFTGMVMWMWLNTILWTVGGDLRAEQQRGTLESNWMTPAPRLAILFGSGLMNTAISLIPTALGLVICRVFWGVELTITPFLGLVFIMSMFAVYGLGLIFSAMVLHFKELNAAVFFVRGVFMVFCGLTYPLSILPPWMQAVSKALPLTYSIHLVRRVGLAGATYGSVARDFGILTAFAVILTALGCAVFLAVDRSVKRNGTLGQY